MLALHRNFVSASLALLFAAAAAPIATASTALGGWLGVTLLSGEGQPLSVESVFEGGPAAKAGVKAGDVILSWNGAKVGNLDDLRALLEKTKAGDEGLLGLRRSQKSFTVRITLGDRDKAMREIEEQEEISEEIIQDEAVISEQIIEEVEMEEHAAEAHEHHAHQDEAIEVRPMHVAGGAFLGVRMEQREDSVAILSTVDGSPAQKMGLSAGEVIRSIDGKAVKTTEDVVGAIRAKKPGDRIEVSTTLDEDGETSERTYVFSLGTAPAAAPQAGTLKPAIRMAGPSGPSTTRQGAGGGVSAPGAHPATPTAPMPPAHVQHEVAQLHAEIARMRAEMAEMKAMLKEIAAHLKR